MKYRKRITQVEDGLSTIVYIVLNWIFKKRYLDKPTETYSHVIFLLVGIGKWKIAARRLSQQLSIYFPKSRIIVLNEFNIREHVGFMDDNNYDSSKKGAGYWRWKPIMIHEIFTRYVDKNNVLVYLDSGFEVNPSVQFYRDFNRLISNAITNELLVMHLEDKLSSYTRKSVLDEFEISKKAAQEKKMSLAGFFILTRNRTSEKILKEWRECAEISPCLFEDSISGEENYPDFISHRHDQSILSCLVHKYDISTMPDTTDPNSKTSSKPPFLAMRNRHSFPIRPGTWGRKIIKLSWRFKSKMTMNKV